MDYTLAQLPTLSRDFLDKAKGLMTQLTGDPAYIEVGTEPSIDLSEDVEAVEEKNDEEEEETTDDKQKAKKMSEDTHFREIHRVAYIVKVCIFIISLYVSYNNNNTYLYIYIANRSRLFNLTKRSNFLGL